MEPPPKEARDRLRKFPLKDDPLTELNVRPMLSADLAWEADFEARHGEEEKLTLLDSQTLDTTNR